MRWQQGRRSTNVEDRRGQKVRKAGAIGGGTALLMGGLGLLLGGDPFYILMMLLETTAGGQAVQTRAPTTQENVAAEFVTSVLAYTEDTWAEIFAEEGLTYEPATRVQQAQRAARGQAQANALSVMLELQADCYAGVWANHANEREQRASGMPLLDDGDLEEGLRTAAAIGDDRLMRQAGRAARPESFTHGTSEQRANWLSVGFQTGDMEACDTFSAAGY